MLQVAEALMINPMLSDVELETWFIRHCQDQSRFPDDSLLPIAPWIPIISLPANDR